MLPLYMNTLGTPPCKDKILDSLFSNSRLDNLSFPSKGNTTDNQSIPLLPKIKGSKAYKDRLTRFCMAEVNVLVHNNPDVKSFNRRQMNLFMEHLIHSACFIASRPKDFKSIGISADRNTYSSKEEPYSILSYNPSQSVLKLLLYNSNPYLRVLVAGTWNKQISEGMRGRYEPTKYLLDKLTNANLIFDNHPFGTVVKKSNLDDFSYLEVSKGEGRTHLSRKLNDSEMVLPKMSKRLSSLVIDFDLPNYEAFKRSWDFGANRHRLVHKTGTALKRIFSASDGVAGRIYGHWLQHAPSSLRQYATFNRMPTTEKDFKSLQLMLLYGMSELTPPKGDLYDIKPGIDRFIFKNIFTRTVGNKNREKALQSIRKSFKDLAPTRMKDAEELFDLFWDYHKPVSEQAFNGEVWKELQTLDSQLILNILSKLDNLDIVAVPIHDSLIVQKRYEVDLISVMQESICEMFPNLISEKERLIG